MYRTLCLRTSVHFRSRTCRRDALVRHRRTGVQQPQRNSSRLPARVASQGTLQAFHSGGLRTLCRGKEGERNTERFGDAEPSRRPVALQSIYHRNEKWRLPPTVRRQAGSFAADCDNYAAVDRYVARIHLAIGCGYRCDPSRYPPVWHRCESCRHCRRSFRSAQQRPFGPDRHLRGRFADRIQAEGFARRCRLACLGRALEPRRRPARAKSRTRDAAGRSMAGPSSSIMRDARIRTAAGDSSAAPGRGLRFSTVSPPPTRIRKT